MFRIAPYATLAPILDDVSGLPGAQAAANHLGGVGCVWIKGLGGVTGAVPERAVVASLALHGSKIFQFADFDGIGGFRVCLPACIIAQLISRYNGDDN